MFGTVALEPALPRHSVMMGAHSRSRVAHLTAAERWREGVWSEVKGILLHQFSRRVKFHYMKRWQK